MSQYQSLIAITGHVAVCLMIFSPYDKSRVHLRPARDREGTVQIWKEFPQVFLPGYILSSLLLMQPELHSPLVSPSGHRCYNIAYHSHTLFGEGNTGIHFEYITSVKSLPRKIIDRVR